MVKIANLISSQSSHAHHAHYTLVNNTSNMLLQTARNATLRAARAASITSNTRLITAAAVRGKHTLPDLPYDYNAVRIIYIHAFLAS